MYENKVVPIDKRECCGCGICTKICKFNAIKMIKDDEGFEYPVVDEEKCRKCGMCVKNCAFYNAKRIDENIKEKKAYILIHKNNAIRANSRSGGAFVAFSNEILKNNGVIYGCVLTNDNKVVHVRAENCDERDLMCKSKYVQSNIINIFDLLIRDLANGKKVLFTGTGCQIEGINNLIKYTNGSLKRNLYTIDFVCHGTVSPVIFEDYIRWIEKKYKGKVTKFEFRDKELFGWREHVESYYVNGKKRYSAIYKNVFCSSLPLRQSCYNCKYTKVNRNSDLTIGDAWGIENVKEDLFDNKGASLVIVQTNKGQELIDKINEECNICEVPVEQMLQPNLKKPTEEPIGRREFWEIYKSDGIKKIIKKYGKSKFKRRVKLKIKIMLGNYKKINEKYYTKSTK